MDISLRSVLTAGVTAVTATAVVAAPSLVPTPASTSQPAAVTVPVVNTAAVSPFTLVSPLGEDSAIQAEPQAIPALPAAAATGNGLIMDIYNTVEPWVQWGFEVATWAVGWVPWIGLLSGQIMILYNAGEPVVRSWFQSAQYLVDLQWGQIPGTLWNGVTTGVNNLVQGEIDWVLSFLPPLPPLTASASAAALDATESGPAVGPLAKASEAIRGAWDNPIAPRLQSVVDELSKKPFTKLAKFDVNDSWDLVDLDESTTLTRLPFDLRDLNKAGTDSADVATNPEAVTPKTARKALRGALKDLQTSAKEVLNRGNDVDKVAAAGGTQGTSPGTGQATPKADKRLSHGVKNAVKGLESAVKKVSKTVSGERPTRKPAETS